MRGHRRRQAVPPPVPARPHVTREVVATRFGGLPTMEEGETWPLCDGCADDLTFVAQVDHARDGLHDTLPIGFFTFFYCWNCHPWGRDRDRGGWLVRSYTALRRPKVLVHGAGPDFVEHHAVPRLEKSLPDRVGMHLHCPELWALVPGDSGSHEAWANWDVVDRAALDLTQHHPQRPHDADLSLDPVLALRPVGGQHVDVEVVVPGESDRLRMQRNRLTWSNVPPRDRLGAVVDDAHRHAAEVRERLTMAVEERRQVLAGGEAAERDARVGQRHVKRVDLRNADMGEDLALIPPVDLGLSTRNDLEPTVQTRQFAWADTPFLRDPGPGFLQVELHPLIVDRDAVLLGQALVDHSSFEHDLGPEHCVDQRRDLVHHPPRPLICCLSLRPRERGWVLQVLADRPAVQPGLLRDLPQAHRTGLVQRTKPPQLQPAMWIQEHRQPPLCHPEPTAADSRPTPRHRIKNGARPSVRGGARSLVRRRCRTARFVKARGNAQSERFLGCRQSWCPLRVPEVDRR
ncbi:hypothetical protein EES46_04975 [Streptomyces sp. ADI98-10]|nr:hypothetical protein EES46_04975 [Streptomyces sp. ADI98-10]